MTTFALIPCSKSKARVRCTAREMYWPSALFRGAWRTALERGEIPLILSAKYGLLRQGELIDPYDETLIGKPKPWRQQWSADVFVSLRRLLLPTDRVVSYLGALYSETLVPEIRSLGIEVTEPLRGLTQGKRLAWFQQTSRPI
jgi:hypothetical protein